MLKKLGVAMCLLALMASNAVAAIFPVDTASTATITSLTADIVAWGVVFIGVALTIMAYKKIKSLVGGGDDSYEHSGYSYDRDEDGAIVGISFPEDEWDDSDGST